MCKNWLQWLKIFTSVYWKQFNSPIMIGFTRPVKVIRNDKLLKHLINKQYPHIIINVNNWDSQQDSDFIVNQSTLTCKRVEICEDASFPMRRQSQWRRVEMWNVEATLSLVFRMCSAHFYSACTNLSKFCVRFLDANTNSVIRLFSNIPCRWAFFSLSAHRVLLSSGSFFRGLFFQVCGEGILLL